MQSCVILDMEILMNIQKALKKLKNLHADYAILCGSGHNNVVTLKDPVIVDYKTLGFQFGMLEGHNRCFQFGEYEGKQVVVASRFHLYEDGKTDNLFNLFKIFKHLGVKTVIATTAVGGINEQFNAGDIMVICDHINMTGTNPLVGRLPISFVDVSAAYDVQVRQIAKSVAQKAKIKLFEGTHLQTIGPSYETPAEVNLFRKLGADTVSMSTAYDSICAAYHGIKVLAFASISNKAVCEGCEPLSHDDVLKASEKASKKLSTLIAGVLKQME